MDSKIHTRPEESYIRSFSDDDQKRWVINIIDRMCKAYQLEGKGLKDQLAERLGIRTSTIKGWVFNRRIPFHAMVTCNRDTGANLTWLLEGKMPKLEITEEVSRTMVKKVSEHLFAANRYNLISTANGMDVVANNIIEDVESVLGVSTSNI
ncbi:MULTISPECIES: helix-turn-helix domain-containing protein [Pseudoalteromonas]|uniref:helix-turn-helix domain-containing protein n=1 Tax=Pseudoalteromonas TaxID=53246 RepID=UPI0015835189|nr:MULTISPECIES: helix-turn-helix domain-containing protein [Pseudoalteromonas]MDI4654233.1 helix-turn-helix domain containing protein [Pseudoalteromonas shioyasakiensis]NUJ40187.1 helix-turn-helix domain-containing protein [Pseudoalteromonas sp. 0303]